MFFYFYIDVFLQLWHRTGAHSCRLNSVLFTDSTAVWRPVMVECTQKKHPPRLACHNAAAWILSPGYLGNYAFYYMKRTAWNGGHHGFGFTWTDAFFAKICAKNDFHISATVTFIFRKKLSCRRETARRFVTLNILLRHSRSFEMAMLSRACVSRY